MTANPTLSNRKLAVIRSADFKVQSDFGTPILVADLNFWQPQTNPAGHGIIPFREQIRDCGGENVIIEQITGKIARFTITFNPTAKALAGYYAYLQGVAAAPTGSVVNEVQTLDLNGATAGGFKVSLDWEGIVGTSAVINFDDTNAEIQSKLEGMRNIKSGNILVSGTDPKTLTFQNGRGGANVPLMTVVSDTTTGGTGVTIAAGTNGSAKVHEITRTDDETPVLFSFIEGFKDDDEGFANRYQDLVLADYTITAPRRGTVSLTVVAYGDPTPELMEGYTIPTCVTELPLKTADVKLKVGSDWITEDLRELTYTESNNVDISEEALKFDDVTPAQLERGDRTASINALATGLPTASLYEFAANEDTAFAAVEIHFGQPGERLSIYNPHTQFRLDDGLIEFVGTKNRSAFRLLGRPSPDNTGVIARGTYSGAFTGTFLTASA